MKEKEAPALARQVKRGDLPPVDQRLPKRPLVVTPNDRVGTYGGTLRSALIGPTDTARLQRTVGYEMLLRWKPDTVTHTVDEIIPNIAESFQANPAGTVYTVKLREGMRWSDGEAFTADDIVFAVDDVMLNTTISPIPPAGLKSGRTKTGRIEKIDDYTVRFIFPAPKPFFPHINASKNLGLYNLAGYPRHYLEKFHAKYASDAQATAKKEGLDNWVELFGSKADLWNNEDLPTLNAWMPSQAVNSGAPRAVFERNPYYWKVDTAGRQLPYLDTVVFEFRDLQVMLLDATNGDIDFHDTGFNTPDSKPVLATGRTKGGYHFFNLKPAVANDMNICLNLTHKDPVLREIFQNKNFRIGLSHAINRKEVIQSVFKDQGAPWQMAPRPEAAYFDKELGEEYTEYDVKLANEYLDRAGYGKRDGQGRRLGPDGSPILFKVEMPINARGGAWLDTMNLVKTYWNKVGVDITVKSESGSLYVARYSANEHDAAVIDGDPGGLDPHLSPDRWVPIGGQNLFARPWADWYTSEGSSGEKPPAPTVRQQQLWDQFNVTMSRTDRDKLMAEILRIAREEFYSIGISRPVRRYGIAKDNLHNTFDGYIDASNYPNPAPINFHQFFKSGG